MAVRGFLESNRQPGVVFDLSSKPIQPGNHLTDEGHRGQKTDPNAHAKSQCVLVVKSEHRSQKCFAIPGVVCKRWRSSKRDPVLKRACGDDLEKRTIEIGEVLTSFYSSANLHGYRHFLGLSANLK